MCDNDVSPCALVAARACVMSRSLLGDGDAALGRPDHGAVCLSPCSLARQVLMNHSADCDGMCSSWSFAVELLVLQQRMVDGVAVVLVAAQLGAAGFWSMRVLPHIVYEIVHAAQEVERHYDEAHKQLWLRAVLPIIRSQCDARTQAVLRGCEEGWLSLPTSCESVLESVRASDAWRPCTHGDAWCLDGRHVLLCDVPMVLRRIAHVRKVMLSWTPAMREAHRAWVLEAPGSGSPDPCPIPDEPEPTRRSHVHGGRRLPRRWMARAFPPLPPPCSPPCSPPSSQLPSPMPSPPPSPPWSEADDEEWAEEWAEAPGWAYEPPGGDDERPSAVTSEDDASSEGGAPSDAEGEPLSEAPGSSVPSDWEDEAGSCCSEWPVPSDSESPTPSEANESAPSDASAELSEEQEEDYEVGADEEPARRRRRRRSRRGRGRGLLSEEPPTAPEQPVAPVPPPLPAAPVPPAAPPPPPPPPLPPQPPLPPLPLPHAPLPAARASPGVGFAPASGPLPPGLMQPCGTQQWGAHWEAPPEVPWPWCPPQLWCQLLWYRSLAQAQPWHFGAPPPAMAWSAGRVGLAF